MKNIIIKADEYVKRELAALGKEPEMEDVSKLFSPKTMEEFITNEARFVDHCVRQDFPAWLIRLAESDGKLASYAQRFIAALAYARGIRVERVPNRGIRFGKGFRPGHSVQMLESITTRVVRKKKVIGETTFNLGIVIT